MGIETTGWMELLPAVADVALRGAVLLGLAGLLTLALRRRSAALRHLVWTVALAGLMVMPGLRAVVPELAVVPASWGGVEADGVVVEGDVVPPATFDPTAHVGDGSEQAELAAGIEIASGTPPERAESGEWSGVPGSVPGRVDHGSGGAGQATFASGAVREGDPAPIRAARWLVVFWLFGTATLLLPVLAGWVGVRRLERRATAFETPRVRHLATRLALRIGLNREFRLIAGSPRAMPMTWGIFRPVILLPREARDWAPARLEAVLLHELAHVRRHDCLTQLVAEIARAAYWFNPLVWLAARRLRIERERACDDVALAAGARASRYAAELLGLARAYRASRATTLAAVAMARPSQLSDRLLAVLDEGRSRAGVARRSALRVLGCAALIALPIAGLVPAAAASPQPGTVAFDDGGGPDAPSPEAPRPVAARAGSPGPVSPQPESPRPESRPRSPLAALALVQEPTCVAAEGSWSRVSHQTDDDEATIEMRRPGCELDVRLEGEVEFDGEAVEVRRLGPDARIRLEEDNGQVTRFLEVLPGPGGAPVFDYRVDRRSAAFDGGAQAWYRAVLLHLFRSAGFAAEERVTAILARQGVEGVLAELGRIESSFVFARYAGELLEQARLEEAALRALVRSSTRRVDSDHYMAEILEAVARHQPLRGGILDDYIVASMSLDSDHYRSETLRMVVRSGGLTNEQVAGVLEAATAMDSDHYKAELLTDVADRYALEPGFRHAYLTATAEMDSDHYRSEVLQRLLRRTDLSAGELADVIAAASILESDHYRGEILRTVAERGLDDPALHRAFFDAAAGLDSDHTYGETMRRLIDQPRLAPELLVTVLNHAGVEVESDHTLSELLLRVLDRHAVTGPAREAFLQAMRSIDSEHSRGRVADALLRADRG